MTITEDIRFLRLGYIQSVKDMFDEDLSAELRMLSSTSGNHGERIAIVRAEMRRRKVRVPRKATTTTRRSTRTEALACILSDGLTFNWFSVETFDFERCRATVEAASPDTDGDYDLYEVGPRDVARGLRMYRADLERRQVPKNAYAWRTVLFGQTNGAEGDYDAATADAVMQFAIYGEIVFESRSEAVQRGF